MLHVRPPVFISVILFYTSCNFNLITRLLRVDTEPQFWINNAEEDLNRAIANTPNTGVARNIILFVGDGMGISTITAARIFKGQLDSRPGEETKLNFQQLPHVALSKVNIPLITWTDVYAKLQGTQMQLLIN